MIAAALTFGVVWVALAIALTALYARAAANRRRQLTTYAARVHYSTEALTIARQRLARQHNTDLWRELDRDAA